MINTSVFALMILIGLFGPILLAVIWKATTKQPFKTILVGALIFFAFAIILESVPKLFLFVDTNAVGRAVLSNYALYVGTAALLAGLFEETGRLVAFKFLLKDRNDKRTAISYGIGHGGFEAMYLLVIGGIQNLSYAAAINNGTFSTLIEQVRATAPDQVAALAALPAQLMAVGFGDVAISTCERVSAVCIHIACSIIMYKAVKEPRKLWLWPVAILLHASIDVFAGLYQVGIITNLFVLEGLLLSWAVAMLIFCIKVPYKRMSSVEQQ